MVEYQFQLNYFQPTALLVDQCYGGNYSGEEARVCLNQEQTDTDGSLIPEGEILSSLVFLQIILLNIQIKEE